MRLLQVVHQYPPEHLGGVELNTQRLAAGLAALGHAVTLFYRTSATGRGVSRWQEASGVAVRAAHAGLVEPTGRFLSTFRDPTLLESFGQVVEEARPDVVHLQHLMGLPVALVRLLEARAIPYVVTLHDYWWLCANAQLLTNDSEELCEGPRLWVNCGRCALARAGRGQAGAIAAPAIAPLFAYRHRQLRRALARASAVVVPTPFTREVHERAGILESGRAQVIPYGIPVSPRPSPTEKRGGTGARLRVVYVGGLARQKGVHLLVRAVAALPPEAIELTIYGDPAAFPDYVAHLRQGAGPNVTFAGRVPNDELPVRLVGADVVVVPSIWYETAAMVIQEAFAAGVPVVASAIGALRDRVRHEVDGLQVRPNDWQALRDALLRLHDAPDLLARLRSGIRPVDTIEAQVSAMDALYGRLLVTGPAIL